LRLGAENVTKKYWKVYGKVIKRLEKEQAEEEEALFQRTLERDKKGLERGLSSFYREQIDYLSEHRIEEAMLKEGYVKTYEQRTKKEKYIRTHTHRMLRKAKANIEAVEKGMFGVGHI
jgi:hypothetical protein